MPISPDSKDWTWVLSKPCPECGFDSSGVAFRDIPALTLANAEAWPVRLTQPDVRDRPDADTWSPLEYAAHVRDVFRIFHARLDLMLAQETPTFANWDQDATAVVEGYGEQDPRVVAGDLVAAAEELASAFSSVDDAQLERTGLRSDGRSFTVESLARYFIHDPIHHLHDVQRSPTT